MSFESLNLNKTFVKSITAAGYDSPTPLQSKLIPIINEGKSALVWSQNAAGKTGSFLIPSINYILENPAPEKRGARILILTSRRDRVSQINFTIKKLTAEQPLRFGFIVSGRPYQTQMRLMRRPLDMMIATPGRLNDLMENKKADFSQLEILIVDDYANIHKKNLHPLINHIKQQASQLKSSIIFARDEEPLASMIRELFSDADDIILKEKHEVKSGARRHHKHTQKTLPPSIALPDKLHQVLYTSDDYTHKIALMDYFLDEFADKEILIHTSTDKIAETLQENLTNHGHNAELINHLNHEELSSYTDNILIASDYSDLQALPEAFKQTFIHFDLPSKTDKYLQRLSIHQPHENTDSLILADGFQYSAVKHLEKTLGTNLDIKTVPGLEPLQPFTNKGNKHQKKTGKHHKHNHHKKQAGTQHNDKQKRHAKSNRQQSNKNQQKRHHKGAYGRLNGGTQRKHKQNIGVAKTGIANKDGNNDRNWQADFAEPRERQRTSGKEVVIRYKDKKRNLIRTEPDE